MRTILPALTTPLALTALVAALAAGCGAEESAPAAPELSDTEHNEADVAFATEMIPHHAQALTLVDLTAGRELDPELAAIADDIRAEQSPEVQTMAGWLTSWDEEVPETIRDHSNAGRGGDRPSEVMADLEAEGDTMTGMPGMLTSEQLATLETASDDEFAGLWVEAMIAHHEGAIDMATTETEEGRYRPAVDLAEDVIDAQTAEIAELERLG